MEKNTQYSKAKPLRREAETLQRSASHGEERSTEAALQTNAH